jgi:hypothetical protein
LHARLAANLQDLVHDRVEAETTPRHVGALRFVVVQVVALALVGMAVRQGWVGQILASDTTYLVHAIVATLAVGLVASLRIALRPADRADLAFVRLIAYLLVPMGLVGTVVGFIIGLLSVDTSAAGDPAAVGRILDDVLHGMAIALYNTLVASVGHIWMRVNLYLLLPRHPRAER